MTRRPVFPTEKHAEVAQVVADYASGLELLDTVLVVNSCARGTATEASDLDMAILLAPPVNELEMESAWRAYAETMTEVVEFCRQSRYSAVHLDFFDGSFLPTVWDDGGGPDEFEVEIGNRIAYSVPFRSPGPLYQELRDSWLPYYPDALQKSRLSMVRESLRYDLDHIPFYVSRRLYLQAFDRMYKALRQYLQALFISMRTYPIAYNKWLREQLTGIGKEDLYEPIISLLSMEDLESGVMEKAARLRELESDLS